MVRILGWLRRGRRRRGFAVIDVETTGLMPGRDRVVEIAVVRTDARGRVVDEWATLVNPGGSVGPTFVHGVAAADVRTAPRFSQLVGELNARLAGRVVVAHNARFDLAFLQTEYARAGWDLPSSPYLCTLEASRLYLPDLERRRLLDCCWAYDISLVNAHSALGDARATAVLLGRYLTAARRRTRPRPHHLRMPIEAARVTWPPVPLDAVTTVGRPPRDRAVEPAPPGTLWTLLDALPLSSAIEHGAPAEATEYLELLFEVLEDGILTEADAHALAELARVYSLSHAQIEAAHRGFLLALAHRIVQDGRVTRDERDMLLTAAAALGADDELPNRVLDAARAALYEQRSAECRPLPTGWPHGEPLRIGQGVAFTGGDPLVRARLEGAAQLAGLRVTGSVSTLTAALVTDGANPDPVKARLAREFGTRVVSPDLFVDLLTYIHPATSGIAPDEPATPAAIRAWARAHGFPVGTQGRLTPEIIAAYQLGALDHRPAPQWTTLR